MTVVVDTNVMISGLFWDGLPFEVVAACVEGKARLAVSTEILAEYEQVGHEFQKKHPSVFLGQMLSQVAATALLVEALPLDGPVCRDPKDEMFIACALAAKADCLVSGDKDLLVLDGRFGFGIVRPRPPRTFAHCSVTQAGP